VRQAAKARKQERFTALLHDVTVNLLRGKLLRLKNDFNPPVASLKARFERFSVLSVGTAQRSVAPHQNSGLIAQNACRLIKPSMLSSLIGCDLQRNATWSKSPMSNLRCLDAPFK
jgi:hypothetical protein